MEFFIFLAIGAIAGFTAGLFGVGGGLIIVPILYVIFSQMGYSSDSVMHMAIGTSLATIIVTSISSLMSHHSKGGVIWQVFKNLTPGLFIGAFLGAGIAKMLASQSLQLIIGAFALWVAYTMLRGAKTAVIALRELPSRLAQCSVGVIVGIASAIFGIGGGSLTVPYLSHYGIIMQKAVGTSAACGLPIAIAGALGFIVFGQTADQTLPNTIGFVHIYAFLGISLMSFFAAKLGARTAHALSQTALKKCFALLLGATGCFFLSKSLC